MDVKIYPDDFNAFITAEKVVDKNNQQLSNYVCNVTYTSLTKDQINEIGQQFAKHLSDTDENGNSKAGLHKVALTGDYAQLENKPSASNLQGFHEVAFSGQASALDNDSGFLTAATNAYTNSVASNITNEDIIYWNNKSDFDGKWASLANKPQYFPSIYNQIDKAPMIPPEGFITISHEPDDTHNEEWQSHEVLPFHKVAFTGDYNDLSNQYIFTYLLDLTLGETTDIQNFGTENKSFNNYEDIVFDEETLLKYLINSLIYAYNDNIVCFIQNSNGIFIVENMYSIKDNNGNVLYAYFTLNLCTNNYSILRNNNNLSQEEILSNLDINIQKSIIIADNEKNTLYCKII